MQTIIQSFFLLICCISLGCAQFQQCTTPNGIRGNCISLFQCPILYGLIRRPNLSNNDRQYLAQSQCNFRDGAPWVCCPPNEPVRTTVPPTSPRPIYNGPGLKASDLPSQGECGSQLDDRIVGGEETRITDYPWMALIEYTKPNNQKGFHCGGVLIHKNYVLTASHCVNGKDLSLLRWILSGVRLGEWDQRGDPDCDDGNCADPAKDIDVMERIPHPQYDPQSRGQENDVALLRLARPAQMNDFIKPICLPVSVGLHNNNFDGSAFIVAGWGKTENASSNAIKLKVEVDNVPINECNRVYRQQGVTLTEKQLCAGGTPGKDSCRGDSGGPLMAQHRPDSTHVYYYLAGVVSFGPTPCGLPGWPGVYTRVDQYTDWILANMRP